MTKGEKIRLFVGTTTADKPIAAAKTLSIHFSATVENATTKDTDNEWEYNEVTAFNYDISTQALMRSGETITSSVTAASMSDIVSLYNSASPIKWKISNVSGQNNRAAGATIFSGEGVLSSLVMNAPNRQVATYNTQIQGYGDVTVGDPVVTTPANNDDTQGE